MTTNQIEFAKLQETRRHNVKTEGQTDWSNIESKRHNQEVERVNWYGAQSSREVGLKQASASAAQAAAAQQSAAANWQNALTRQYESSFLPEQYRIQAQDADTRARTQSLAETRYDNSGKAIDNATRDKLSSEYQKNLETTKWMPWNAFWGAIGNVPIIMPK